MSQTVVTEISGKQASDALLARSALDVVLAGTVGDCFNCAHGKTNSVFVLRVNEEIKVWHLVGGDKQARRDAAAGIRAMFAAKGWTV